MKKTLLENSGSRVSEDRLRQFNEQMGRYMPPRETWTPADESWQPADLLRVPVDEAEAMQLKAIKYTFTHHYDKNRFYRTYCETRGFTPDDIRTNDDLERIPLLPDLTFKMYPSGVDFASWLGNTYTGKLPSVDIRSTDRFDDVIEAFNTQGLVLAYSTGTNGQYSVIPRDELTYNLFLYNTPKAFMSLWDIEAIDHSISLFPNPQKTHMWAGPGSKIMEVHRDHHYALDFEISAELAIRAMSGAEKDGSVSESSQEQLRKIFIIGTKWLERYEKTTDTLEIMSPTGILDAFMDGLEQQGKRFEFGERLKLVSSGGWKTKKERILPGRFRKKAEEILGIPDTCCLDLYGMTEMNTVPATCPEGHYYHMPYTWFKPLVLDQSLTPVGYGKQGRFAFLDASARSYPGFVMSGDQVRLLEHCPVCDRPGPVLDAIERTASEEMRGCSAQLGEILEKDIGGSLRATK